VRMAGLRERADARPGGHPAVQALRELYARDARLGEYARLLYDQAVVAEGSRVQDPADFARRINDVLVRDARG
jgi:molecular chaperone HtpG